MREINEAIGDISKSSQSGAALTAQIQETADGVKESAIEDRKQVMVRFEEMNRSVSEKIEQSKTVESIASLTDEIIAMTKQTNLLSLNARKYIGKCFGYRKPGRDESFHF